MRSHILMGSMVSSVFLLAAAIGSCAHTDGSSMEAGLGDPDPEHPWLECKVQAELDDVTATIVGGQAAVLTLKGGHRLEIPDTALEQGATRRVRFMQMPNKHVAVRLTPSQTFDAPLTLVLSYAGRECDTGPSGSLRIYRERPNHPHDSLPYPASRPTGQAVAGVLDHFSAFAIAR